MEDYLSPSLGSVCKARRRAGGQHRKLEAGESKRLLFRQSDGPFFRLTFFFFNLRSSSLLPPLPHPALPTSFPVVDNQNPTIQLFPSLHAGSYCERVRVSGMSRLNLKSYASSLYVTVKAAEDMPQRLHGNIGICFHRNASLGTCECGNDDWKFLQKGEWKSVMSPYDTRFIDVKSMDKISGSIIAYVEEEFQLWRLFFLGIGFVMLIAAPIVSNWVPFYYSSSMALGVLLVILLILFQGMKLLPMGRKNILYLTLYGSLLGIGSYIAHYFSKIVNSILVSFGLSEEMHNPVSVFLLVGIALAGAALGYWIVRKFVLSDDGKIHASIAQFVKWAMRIIAMVLILQSSLDALLSLVALGACWSLCSFINSIEFSTSATPPKSQIKRSSLWQQRTWQVSSGSNRNAEFLNRPVNKGSGGPLWGSPSYHHGFSNSPVKGKMISTPSKSPSTNSRSRRLSDDFYSTFHKTPTRKFSKMEWEDFTRESTRDALSDWASTPEVAKWIADNTHRMKLSHDSSSDDTMESSSGSSEETAVDDGNRLSLFKWSFALSV
ncbi:uncharacterized protein LOC110030708 [Phalaenopsis equestris]|uniref:uncharacterized protein LOC110030708 n=1 Tax=Phalaenopsis equestris TaxID=78828 RepID=UPI0009E24E42|nr:uncharacterized protein LOC110030708 [Phalaenopsis equestris]